MTNFLITMQQINYYTIGNTPILEKNFCFLVFFQKYNLNVYGVYQK